MRSRSVIGILFCSLILTGTTYGQTGSKWGKLSGSLESNIGVYVKDKTISDLPPDRRFATNTYLNMGYTISDFRFGLQYEIYEPPLIGHPDRMKGNKLIQGFGEYQISSFAVRLGSIYEQFGSGLMFRSYEERSLGINNSVLGLNVRWNPIEAVTLKAIAGVPRKYMEYNNVRLCGVDGEVDVMGLVKAASGHRLVLGGGWVLRDDREMVSKYYPSVVRLWSTRADWGLGIFTLGAEYVAKSPSMGFDAEDRYFSKKGSGLLLNMSVDFEGIAVSGVFRRLESMDFRIDNEVEAENVSMNYLPALTKQHKYTLAAIYPYNVGKSSEIGGQVDVFGEIPAGWLGEKPLKISLNGAYYNRLEKKEGGGTLFWGMKGAKLFREVGIELERKWGRKVKTILSYINQNESEFVLEGYGDRMINSNIIIGDVLYKVTPKNSLRMELQHMWTNTQDDKAWLFVLVECGLAPGWMIFGSDLCNYNTQLKPTHYYNAGVSFSRSFFRGSVSYGRNRAGYQCVGGICRYVPDYTGMNMLVSLIF